MPAPFPSFFHAFPALASGLLLVGLVSFQKLEAQTVITIVNPSFETPPPTVFPDYTLGADGWTRTRNDTDAGTFAPSGGLTPQPKDGSQVGYANGSGGLQQVLSTTFAVGQVYSFSVWIGYRSDDIDPLGTTGMIDLGYFDGTFHSLSSRTDTPALGQFDFVSGAYQATAADAGRTIAVQLRNIGSAQAIYDVVQLTASPIPEPASVVAVFGAAALAAATLRRSRRSAGSASAQT